MYLGILQSVCRIFVLICLLINKQGRGALKIVPRHTSKITQFVMSRSSLDPSCRSFTRELIVYFIDKYFIYTLLTNSWETSLYQDHGKLRDMIKLVNVFFLLRSKPRVLICLFVDGAAEGRRPGG